MDIKEGKEGEMNWEIGIDNENLLYIVQGTGNSTQCSVVT